MRLIFDSENITGKGVIYPEDLEELIDCGCKLKIYNNLNPRVLAKGKLIGFAYLDAKTAHRMTVAILDAKDKSIKFYDCEII